MTTPPPPPAGVRCPRCGGRLWAVVCTWHRAPGVTVRVKRCRGCGHRIRARETIESNSAGRKS